MATTQYEEHLHAIYFLLDLYDQKRKAYRRLIDSIDEQEKCREKEEESLSKQRQSIKQQSHNSKSLTHEREDGESIASESDNSDLIEIAAARGKQSNKEQWWSRKKSSDKYTIKHSVSGIALSKL